MKSGQLGGGENVTPYKEPSDLPRDHKPWPSQTPGGAEFIDSDGVISSGIIITVSTCRGTQTAVTSAAKLTDYWT
jgi:hypothetical protein